MPYDWNDPPDRQDVYDRFVRKADDEPAIAADRSRHRDRGQPFTEEEIDDYLVRRGGKITYRHPQQAERDRRDARRAERKDARAGLTELQKTWAKEFDP